MRNLKGFPGYRVYKDGRIYSLNKKAFLKPFYSGGYLQVKLVNYRGKRITFPLHRVVAMVWCNPPSNARDYVVHHKDGDNTHNHADNLEWVTRSENSKYAVRKSNPYLNEIKLLKKARQYIDTAVRVLSEEKQTEAIDSALEIMVQVTHSINESRSNNGSTS